jgi:hypothetical protein
MLDASGLLDPNNENPSLSKMASMEIEVLSQKVTCISDEKKTAVKKR